MKEVNNFMNKTSNLNDKTIVSILKAKTRMHFSIPIMIRLFETFINSSYLAMQELIDAAEKNDMEHVKLHTHSIKGSALSLCFDDIAELCQLLEDEEKTNSGKDNLSIAKDLQNKINEIYHEKDTILASLTELD